MARLPSGMVVTHSGAACTNAGTSTTTSVTSAKNVDDNKIAFIRMEGRGFGDVPLELELRLSVQDSPNSAGVVIDAIRCAKLGLERGIGGPLGAASAYYMKSPPKQMRDSVAFELTEAFIQGSDPGGDSSMEAARTTAGE